VEHRLTEVRVERLCAAAAAAAAAAAGDGDDGGCDGASEASSIGMSVNRPANVTIHTPHFTLHTSQSHVTGRLGVSQVMDDVGLQRLEEISGGDTCMSASACVISQCSSCVRNSILIMPLQFSHILLACFIAILRHLDTFCVRDPSCAKFEKAILLRR
jgi:hypothetical protein